MKLAAPLIIAFSGGRTSGMMLRLALDHFGGALPDGVEVVFCNTGKEHSETLRFVQACSDNWGVRIRWLEWAEAELPKDRWREVDYATASREGEPFAAVIKRKGYLPNPVTRFCTTEMKIHASHRFARHGLGWGNGYSKAIGLRHDEPHRVARARGREQAGGDPWLLEFPLFDDGITVADVGAFWSAQPFDLGLPSRNGVTALGNCDLCFLKGPHKTASLIRDNPGRAVWWAEQERLIGATFRNDRRSYAGIMAQQPLTLDEDDDDAIDCNCTD